MTAGAGRASRLEETACAKINLTLHVLGRRMDGYHELQSLVAFATIADRLALEPGEPEGLVLTGPGAAMLADSGGVASDNLVMRAQAVLRGHIPGLRSGRFTLEKRLPVASGIGGGSADAAAALRLLARLNAIPVDAPVLYRSATEIGADVSVCLAGRTRNMSGIGEILGPAVVMPRLPALLVNPGIAVPTPDVFRTLGLTPGAPSCALSPTGGAATVQGGWPSHDDVAGWMELIASGRNELAEPAERLYPIIAAYREALAACPGCMLARMSGSGATLFGLFADADAAQSAEQTLRELYPEAWIVRCEIGDAQAESRSAD